MKSRVPWGVESVDPAVRERAEVAARRAGMSLSDWVNSTIGDALPLEFRATSNTPPAFQVHEAREVADIHQRLDSISRQIEQMTWPAARGEAPRPEQGVARRLNDAISRLDARLSQISDPARSQERSQDRPQHKQQDRQCDTDRLERPATQAYRNSPPLSPTSLDSAMAEIAARYKELDNGAPQRVAPRSAPPVAPEAPPSPDFSALERHLIKITNQIEALRRPDAIEQSISAFRSELTEIRHAITEAMPQRAIESIEGEIRSLSHRIDENRHSGVDGQALAGIERTLGEIHEVLQSLTPAEQLTGYDEALRNLGAKLDMILRSNSDPGTMQQLEGAIVALRTIVSNVASNDALVRLSEDVRMLSSKVDQLSLAENRNESFAVLEQRIAALTSKLESRDRLAGSENNEQLEAALRALSDRIDRLPIGNDSAAALAHLEQRVSYLIDRLEASGDHRAGNFGRVEEGLHDILRHLERQQAAFATLATNSRGAAEPTDAGMVDMVRRELTDIRFNQSETNRHTQDSLETVHNTLGHVVDRLAMIESDLRTPRSQSDAPPAELPSPPSPVAHAAAPRVVMPAQLKPELPNPATAQAQFVAAPRDFQPASHTTAAAVAAAAPLAITEILEAHAAQSRATIEPDLPPDHPLEPGTRPSPRTSSPSERIAASESAISEISASPDEKVTSSSFIAAARRAAQAAAAAPPAEKSGRTASRASGKEASTITSKIRSLLVGVSVVVIVLGTFRTAMTLLDRGSAEHPTTENASELQPQTQMPAETDPARPDSAAPALTSPTPIGRQSLSAPLTNTDASALVAIPQTPAPQILTPQAPAVPSDITGAIPPVQDSRSFAMVQIPPSERLPEAIGGAVLRTSAMKGDAAAAYEVAVRYAEGKGVAPNFEEAAKWYDRAARAGVVPAMFRLGTFYEKGLGVTKDVDIAQRYYVQAAERGNAKAMHNLAVLDADGGGKGANYKSAAQWFRKAAERGIADSQFNLGILYARGIGVEQNLAESFKWFSLAAAKGDADATRKRDEIAKRLDAQSLAAAKLAIQTFTPEPQPDDAVNVASPAGGWDSTSPQAATAKQPLTRRASR